MLLHGCRTAEWFAEESFWKDLYPFTFSESSFASADVQVEKILRLAGVDGGQVLDLCCGPGRHAVPLAKRGFAVTAVDRTRFLLEQARARAAHAHVSVELVLEDMRRSAAQRPSTSPSTSSRRSATSTTNPRTCA